MKKCTLTIISTLLAAAILSSCTTADLSDKNDPQASNKTSSISQPSSFLSSLPSELPSSSSQISSHESSSSLSSIVDELKSSKPIATSQPSSKPSSAPPKSSAPPVSSEPPKSSAPSSKPVVSSEPPASSAPVAPPQSTGVSHEQMKAVWISFLEFDQFQNSSEGAFTAQINRYYDNVVAKGLNTVLVQIRSHGDAMYPSAYYPWSKHVSGTMGVGVSYDPLSIMVSEAHNRGLEFHAWINPYRTMTDSEFSTVGNEFLTKQWYESGNRADYMVKCSDGRWWLKPGNSEVVSLITSAAQEIVSNYSVDGVHIDDYFYGGDPVKIYGDSTATAKANTTKMVKGLHDGIKAIRSSVKFGVSPLGGFTAKNSVPNSDLNYLSTDIALWCTQDGYIDYVIPQIYWEYDHKTQPFTMTLDKWQNLVTANSVALYIGLAPYKSNIPASMIHSQMNDSLSGYRSSGYALFRYDHMLGL